MIIINVIRKSVICLLILSLVGGFCFAQEDNSAENITLVKKKDIKLNEDILRTSTLNYSYPDVLKPVANKCKTSSREVCENEYLKYAKHPDKSVSSIANLEIAISQLAKGDTRKSLNYIETAIKQDGDNPFLPFVKAWVLFSSAQYNKALKEFENLLFLTADFEYTSYAKVGEALSYYHKGNKEKAREIFEYLYTTNPYLISFSAYMISRINFEKKSYLPSITLLQQSLDHDYKNYKSMELLAEVYEKNSQDIASWQAYATLYGLDTNNTLVKSKMDKLAENFDRPQIEYLYYMRINNPLEKDFDTIESEKIKVGLYAGRTRELNTLKSLEIMASSNYIIKDEKMGHILAGNAKELRTLNFDEEIKALNIKNKWGNTQFSAKRPFWIMPEKKGATVLLKNVRPLNILGADYSDKEIKGDVLIIPNKEGAIVVAEMTLEDYLPSVLLNSAKQVKNPEVLKALAIIIRSNVMAKNKQNSSEYFALTDNELFGIYGGVNKENLPVKNAVRQTKGIHLLKDDNLDMVDFYSSCGVLTEQGIKNTNEDIAFEYSYSNILKYLISNPPKDLFSAPKDPTKWSTVKWLYMFDTNQIFRRLKQNYEFSKELLGIKISRRSDGGRVESVKYTVKDSKKQNKIIEVNDIEENLFILGAGSIRSNLFTIIPIHRLGKFSEILIIGYDTGLGKGLCVAGAQGLEAQGKNYKDLLKYYLPNYTVKDPNRQAVKKAPIKQTPKEEKKRFLFF
ncbi:MAG: hypothetical protein HN833_03025 [Elusimicrobiaceae bacterium]|jgi:SpoIID/LytB domain protein|nr:hypothetical protein [Elusimicrobiaceae bacterium]MBT3955428.1 hypothetical protein [Elusimicrobiaceae bacterium]MBT4008770.1 hypothetical protein [Elusimicrobiaceae bacterium]MBT4402294.1 hypothetical protein [Elusimicrobiaceae bacterium]MBT4440102.1 hypothetical protein [Elusimicrobiaceae bacterium]